MRALVKLKFYVGSTINPDTTTNLVMTLQKQFDYIS